MTRTAIVSAMHEELSAVLALMPDEQGTAVAGRDFWLGHLHGHEVVVVLSRIGKVAAATTATVLIERFAVDRIVFTGAAGGLGAGVRVGDVVVATAFLQHDMDASPIFPRHEVPLYGRARFATDTEWTQRLHAAAHAVLVDPVATLGADVVEEFGLDKPTVHSGLIASGDRFVSNAIECAALRSAVPDALAVEMEGAAFGQVCFDYGVPFAAVRTVSDRADDNASGDFLHFIDRVASRYSARLLERLFQSL
jgi:adenosylhomocysteine nucleosidase